MVMSTSCNSFRAGTSFTLKRNGSMESSTWSTRSRVWWSFWAPSSTFTLVVVSPSTQECSSSMTLVKKIRRHWLTSPQQRITIEPTSFVRDYQAMSLVAHWLHLTVNNSKCSPCSLMTNNISVNRSFLCIPIGYRWESRLKQKSTSSTKMQGWCKAGTCKSSWSDR